MNNQQARSSMNPPPPSNSARPTAILVAVCGFAALAAGAACEKKRTQLMVGLVTDVNAPSPLRDVQLEVFDLDNDEQLPFSDLTWQISGDPGQPFDLPGSFGVYSPDGGQTRIRIVATARDAAGTVLVRRTSTLRLVDEQTLFMRMGLVTACMGMDSCTTGQACVEGQCKVAEISPAVFPPYVEGMEGRLACNSGTLFANTSTHTVLDVTGPGCTPREWCEEGTCYRRLTGKKRVGESCSAEEACEPSSTCFSGTCVGMGSLRVSLAWNVVSDFDLHLVTPSGTEIYFGNPEPVGTGAVLDVDQCAGTCVGDAHVENVVFANAAAPGAYRVWVENFDGLAPGAFTIEVAGKTTAMFSGTLPATEDARSMEFTFNVP